MMKANDLQGQVQCLGLIKTEQLLLLKECLWLVVTSLFTSFIPFKTVQFQAINLICLLFCLVLFFFIGSHIDQLSSLVCINIDVAY